MNNTAFNTLCNIAQTVSREQNIVLELKISDDLIVARIIPIEYLMVEDDEEDDEEE